jgi:phosphatidylserine/phosphatidylglycerophosphate/cardiolipin synthase-like enzyme
VFKFRWLLAVSMALVFIGVPPASAYEPPGGATFNVPRPWGSFDQKWKIDETITNAIEHTPAGETVHISTYLLDYAPGVTAMINACKRHVSVRVILDEDIVNKQSKRLIKALNSDNVKDSDGDNVPDPGQPLPGPSCDAQARQAGGARSGPISDRQAQRMVTVPTEDSVTWGADRSYVKRCNGSCRGAGGNMHSKFYLFSKTGTAQDVVMVSSSNINKGGALNGWNDLYAMIDRPESYNKYVSIHREMTDDDKADDSLDQVVDGPYTSRFFPMRNAGKAKDPTLNDLNKVKCHGPLGRTQINISMFYWAGTRGNYLLDKLLNLAHNGCHVSIIYGAPSRQIADRLRTAAGHHVVDLWDSRWDFNNDGYNEIRTHGKYFLVKGVYGGDSSAYLVSTGSQNWVAGSLSRGDEVTLNVELQSAYHDYIQNWNKVRQHSRRLPYH